ncbi:hypothetical protein [Chitinophaga pinensis]|uniref:Uncharacterized protein n=1 Tax=Chitinophaga pinensis TaxID=79329 RepID=A0A5C6LUQ4_9BACT|nr:hypothetical protein [Chitinophaga pinensis]TWW00308.1 hypothetical protein FEF09_11530 [Chitinophaga pinensis]
MQLLQKHIAILNDVRAGKIPLKTFFFKRSKDDADCDLHRQKRSNLITALKFAPLPTDEPLLQELFRQEIKRAEKDPFQGCGDAMMLAASLLSRFKNPENVWLFTAAKRANFDTSCGFDYEFLVSAGIDVTYDLVDNAKASKLKQAFYYVAGASREVCHISQEELLQWETRIQRTLHPSLDTIEQEMYLAIDLNDKEALRELVDQWQTEKTTWTGEEANALLYYETVLKNRAGEIRAYELIAQLDNRAFMRTHALEKLSRLYLENGEALKAWDTLQLALAQERDMARLSGPTVDTIYQLTLAFDNQHPIAIASFSRAMREIRLLPPAQLSRDLAQSARKAAIHMKNKAAAAKIEQIFAPE